MKIKLLAIIVILGWTYSISNCYAEVSSDPELAHYVTWFQEIVEQYGILDLKVGHPKSIYIAKLTLKFGHKINDELGYCQRGPMPTIVIDRGFWEETKDQDKRDEVVLHELGHCVLDREHCEGTLNGIPRSIMAARSFDSKYFRENKDYYLQELVFDPRVKCDITKHITSSFEENVSDLTKTLLDKK